MKRVVVSLILLSISINWLCAQESKPVHEALAELENPHWSVLKTVVAGSSIGAAAGMASALTDNWYCPLNWLVLAKMRHIISNVTVAIAQRKSKDMEAILLEISNQNQMSPVIDVELMQDAEKLSSWVVYLSYLAATKTKHNFVTTCGVFVSCCLLALKLGELYEYIEKNDDRDVTTWLLNAL